MKIQQQNKLLHILETEGEMENVIRDIAETQNNSFYVCDVDRIVKKFNNLMEKLPQFKPYFCKLLIINMWSTLSKN